VEKLGDCELKVRPFSNVRNQIGYCGIWCGSCVVGNGALEELTKKYENVVEKYGLEEWAPKDFHFKEFKQGLASIQQVSSCPGCLKGGGRENCEIRRCALAKNDAECCECEEFMECKNSELLQKMREGARGANLLVKDKNSNRTEFIENGTVELRKSFPSCILLCSVS
jgi:hypothetical protein